MHINCAFDRIHYYPRRLLFAFEHDLSAQQITTTELSDPSCTFPQGAITRLTLFAALSTASPARPHHIRTRP